MKKKLINKIEVFLANSCLISLNFGDIFPKIRLSTFVLGEIFEIIVRSPSPRLHLYDGARAVHSALKWSLFVQLFLSISQLV